MLTAPPLVIVGAGPIGLAAGPIGLAADPQPAGQGIESVRPIRDEIRRRIEELEVSMVS